MSTFSSRGGETARPINPMDLNQVFTHGTGMGLGYGSEVPCHRVPLWHRPPPGGGPHHPSFQLQPFCQQTKVALSHPWRPQPELGVPISYKQTKPGPTSARMTQREMLSGSLWHAGEDWAPAFYGHFHTTDSSWAHQDRWDVWGWPL